MGEIRPGEVALDQALHDDAPVSFIGVIHSGWTKATCPKSIARARERGQAASIVIKPEFRPGLQGLAAGQPMMLLYWLDRSRRDIILQKPSHVDGPRGVFSLRSPVRPNPIGLACVTMTAIDHAAGRITIDAIDCLDGTPLLDLKPWLATIDQPSGVRS